MVQRRRKKHQKPQNPQPEPIPADTEPESEPTGATTPQDAPKTDDPADEAPKQDEPVAAKQAAPKAKKKARGKKGVPPTEEELEEAAELERLAIEDSVEDDVYDEMDPVVRERMLFAARCLELGWQPWKIKDAIQASHAGVSRLIAGRDVARARAKLREDQNATKADLRQEIATFYRGVLADHENPTREQLRAAKQLVEMLGLKDASNYEPPKEDIVVELDEDWRSYYGNRLEEGKVLTANAPAGKGVKLAATNGNGTNGNGTNGAGK